MSDYVDAMVKELRHQAASAFPHDADFAPLVERIIKDTKAAILKHEEYSIHTFQPTGIVRVEFICAAEPEVSE